MPAAGTSSQTCAARKQEAQTDQGLYSRNGRGKGLGAACCGLSGRSPPAREVQRNTCRWGRRGSSCRAAPLPHVGSGRVPVSGEWGERYRKPVSRRLLGAVVPAGDVVLGAFPGPGGGVRGVAWRRRPISLAERASLVWTVIWAKGSAYGCGLEFLSAR